MGKGDHLGEFEHLVLVALVRLGDDAYGVPIRRELEQRAERRVSVGALYATLDRLERKGFVTSREGEATPERGGRAKRYFKLTGVGAQALNRSRATLERMWEGLPDPTGLAFGASP